MRRTKKVLLKVWNARKFIKHAWIVFLLILAIVLVGAGFYSNTEPAWIMKTYPDFYNHGVSDYQNGKGEEAYGHFSHVASLSKDPELKSLAFYNAGTMLGELAVNEKFSAESRFQIIQLAIENLKEALRDDPGNEDAKYNLEFLRSILPELLKRAQEEGQEGDQSQPGYSPGSEDKGY